MTHYPRRAENEAQVPVGKGERRGGGAVAEKRLSSCPRRGSAGEVLGAVRGSIAGGTDTTRPRDDERDEGRKRKLTRSEPDTEGIYYNLKRE